MAAASILRRRTMPKPQDGGRSGIIDIGSNSIRLVIYDGPARIPAILFNEKVLAGLGKGLAKDGRLDEQAADRAEVALRRFRKLAEEMGVDDLRTVATAAVRDASNGNAFLDRLKGLGLAVTLLSGDEEARMAGTGVLAAIPEGDGIVGDLGGGSLELIRIADGQVRDTASFPLGVLRLPAIAARGANALDREVARRLGGVPWIAAAAARPFYLVGGSWRALARLDMHLRGYPLPIIHGYRMAADVPAQLVRHLAQADRKRLREVPGLSASRVPTLPGGAALLSAVVRQLRSTGLVASAFGLREGLIHGALPADVQAQDPLVEATREEGRRQGRFPEHGDLLDRWIAPLFAGEPPAEARLRRAACQLADVGWRAHPEYRADRGLETALHGNWVGVDAIGRGMMAHALHVSFGATGAAAIVERLCNAGEIAQAERWGLAMRLGQRLSGGVAGPLEESSLAIEQGRLILRLADEDRALYGEAVERRHKALASAFGAAPEVG